VPPDYTNANLISELGKEFVAGFEKARANDAYVVCFLPLKRHYLAGPSSKLPEETSQFLTNCREVAEALHKNNLISDPEYHNALDELGEEGLKGESKTVPEKGSVLFCLGNTPEVLASAALLKSACEHFTVHIGREYFERVRAELEDTECRLSMDPWIERLSNRISRGIDEEIYEIISAVSASEISNELVTLDPNVGCLLSLLGFDAQEDGIIWTDDRFTNSYLRRDAIPIIGISEILKALVSFGALKSSEYYGKVNQLRAANARFIPLQSDEILYHLRQSRIADGRIVETAELATLRRYIAACLLQNEILQQPPLPDTAPNPDGEIAFILNFARAVSDALSGLWLDQTISEESRIVCADWILRNLYLNHLGLRNLTSLATPDQNERYLVAISLAGLLSRGIVFKPSNYPEEHTERRSYFDWLLNRVLRARFNADPHLLETVTELLKSLIVSQEEKTDNEDIEPLAQEWLLQAYYEDLPEPIRNEMWLDTDFMARIGIQPIYAITIEDLSFTPDDFFKAIAEAVNGGRATLKAINLDKEITFETCQEPVPPGAFCFDHPEKGKRETIVNQDFELLLDSPTEREALLRRNRHWFDCSEDIFNQAVAEIVSTENPRQRIEKMREWREQSAAVYYDELLGDLEEKKAIDFDELKPPSIEGLLRYLRLEPDVGAENGFSKALDTAARSLIREEGLTLAMNRLTGLPIPLPNALIEAFESLSVEDRYDQIKRLVRTVGSPISRIHLLHLLLHFSDERVEFRRLARRIVKVFLSDESVKEFNAFLAILQWVNNEFYQISDTQGLPVHIKLAIVWTHAHCLFSTFAYFGIPADCLQEKFAQANLGLSREIFDRDSKYWFDVGHPRRAYISPILICALDYALGKSKTEIVDEAVCARLESLAFYDTGKGISIPAPGLLRNWTKASNSLSSFLGGDLGRKALGLLTDENAKGIQQESLQALAEEALEKIGEDEGYVLGWIWLYAVFGDLPSPDNLSARLASLIRQTDFVGLFRKSIEAGCLGMLMASLQAVHFNDQKLRLHLRDQLIQSAQLFARWEHGDEECSAIDKHNFGSHNLSTLVETSLNIALATQPSEETVTDFADIIKNLVGIWPSLATVYMPIVQAFSEGLSISQAKHFWPVLIRLRAE
jgi:hypothetical protein